MTGGKPSERGHSPTVRPKQEAARASRRSADRGVTNRKDALNRPVRQQAPACAGDRSQRRLQARAIIGTTPNLYIRQQTEERSAPICSAPRMGVIKPGVAGLRQTAGHRAHLVGPDFGRAAVAYLHTGDSFYIHSDSLRQP